MATRKHEKVKEIDCSQTDGEDAKEYASEVMKIFIVCSAVVFLALGVCLVI